MRKIYVTLILLLLCTASVFSSQLYGDAHEKEYKTVTPTKKDSGNIISGMVALPSFR